MGTLCPKGVSLLSYPEGAQSGPKGLSDKEVGVSSSPLGSVAGRSEKGGHILSKAAQRGAERPKGEPLYMPKGLSVPKDSEGPLAPLGRFAPASGT